ncbi:proline iminopeptidase-family hydrolase [Actinoplanes sp. NPDC049265]|uniref:proline iminopeptidase-family hydrolase n=1 Tax=Actinoplanes sp. NPDC049265 TaxID=3363902 RepID=UPI003715A585
MTVFSKKVDRRALLRGAAAGGLGVAAATAMGAVPATAAPARCRPLTPGVRHVDVPGGKVWINVVGEGRGLPLLLLHGGPGAGHDYLERLGALADERPVIFYDQLGCGLSDKPDDPSLWTVRRFVAELSAVRRALGLTRYHLLGHSWGGFLAIEHMLREPAGVASAVLASTSGSSEEFLTGCRLLRSRLPRAVQDTLDHYEALEQYTAPEYLAAVQVFYDNYLFRGTTPPDELLRSLTNLDGNQVYAVLNGPNEFVMTGALAQWDRRSRLREIRQPILLTRGRYDEFEVTCTDNLQARLRHTERVEFTRSAHVAMLEEDQAYIAAVRSFLRRHDRRH